MGVDHRRRIAMAQPRHRMDRPEAVAACREVCCDGVVARAWQVAGFAKRHTHKPAWNGSAVPGKTVLIHAEQGLGDTVQFIRFAAQVKERGPRIAQSGRKNYRDTDAQTGFRVWARGQVLFFAYRPGKK